MTERNQVQSQSDLFISNETGYNDNFREYEGTLLSSSEREKLEELEKQVKKYGEDAKKFSKDLQEAKDSYEKTRFDIITMLGVFVGLITYLGLEIQVFKLINNPLLIIGISIFFVASILLFVLTMNLILNKKEKPLYWILGILCILLVISIGFIAMGNFL